MSKHRERARGIKRAHKAIVYKCTECDYDAIYECDISRHCRRHKYATASCRYCNRPFFNTENLKEHLKHEHDRGEERIEISISKLKKRDKSPHRCCRNRKTHVGDEDRKRCSSDVLKEMQRDINIKNRKVDLKYEKNESKDNSNEEIPTNITQDGKNEGNEETEENENHVDTCNRPKLPKPVGFKESYETIVKESFTRPLDYKHINPTKMLNKKLYRANTTLTSRDGATVGKEREMTSSVQMILDNPKINNARARELMKCAFCEFNANSLKNLQTHLGTHDYKSDQYEDADSQNVSVGSDFDTAGDISTFDSNVVGEPSCCVTECLISDKVLNTEYDQMTSDSWVSSTTLSDNECSEVEKSGRIDQTKLDKKDKFVKKPFACSKCFFSTGNLFQLKHHVIAHLYEKATLGYSNNQSDAASLTINPFLPNLSCGIQSTVKPFAGHIFDNRFNLDLKGKKETCSNFLDNITELNSNNMLRPKVNHINDKWREDNNNAKLIGRLKKKDFIKTKKCYKKLTAMNKTTFECLICDVDMEFASKEEVRQHFLTHHTKLREKICSTCSYCSKAFPK